MSYLAIDIGTTAIKVMLYDEKAETAKTISAEYPLFASGKNAEQNADDWWQAVKNSVLQFGDKLTEVKAVCVSSQSITFVPVDKNGKPLYRAITWLDTRAQKETAKIKKRFSSEYIYEITGKKIKPSYTLPKLMWFKANENEIYNKTYKFMFPSDYINYKLSGQFITDYTVASGSMMYDISNLHWSDEILKAFELDKNKLIEVNKMGTQIGKILPEVASQLKINPDAKIILGGQDQKLAAIGAGINEKTATVSLGTATAVSGLKYNHSAMAFAFDGQNKIYEGVLSTSGAAIKWLKNILRFDSYDEMNEAAEFANGNGGVVFSPNFTINAKIDRLNLGVTRGQIVYALYEGIAKEIAKLIPQNIERIILFGGGAGSNILCRLIAKAVSLPTFTSDNTETACIGAVILASNNKIQPIKEKEINV